MKIFLHIGTERTGSSHLQSLSAINRDILQQNGIWFPSESKSDSVMMKGEISSGNAQNLTDALNANNFSACEKFLIKCLEEAKEKECHTLFLSNELLILALADGNKLSQFILLLGKLNVSNIAFLLFLRDPIDHSLSLYKHRAKNGKILEIEEWSKKHYLYGQGLLSFFKEAQVQKIRLKVRKFSKEKKALETILFKECLHVLEDLRPPPKLVNPSLTLSELILIKKISQHRSYLARLLYDKLVRIRRKDKYVNSSIVKCYKESLSNQIVRYEDTWEICNQLLPLGEKISFPKEIIKETSIIQKNGCFSEEQMEAIASIIADSVTLKGRFQIERLKIHTQFVRVLRTLKLKNKRM